MGRTWLIGAIKEDIVWYQDFDDQRSINDLYSVTWLAPLTRVNFSIGGSYLDTRERPGFEIDTRAQRSEPGLPHEARVPHLLQDAHRRPRGAQDRVVCGRPVLRRR